MAGIESEQREALDHLIRTLEVEYRFILYYPRLERLMPDGDTANKVRTLGQVSIRHAETVSQAILALGGAATVPTLEPLPDPLDVKALFSTQLEFERLALWLHSRAAALVPEELAPQFHKIARQEEGHIKVAEEILHRLQTTQG